MVLYTLREMGPDKEYLDFLTDNVVISLRCDDRVTAVTWAVQVLTGMRTFADSMETPPAQLVKAVSGVSRLLADYVEAFENFDGGEK